MKSGAIFFISIIASLMMLLIERLVGINWDFHPDAITYTQKYLPTVASIFENGWRRAPNHLYYLVSWTVNGSITALIAINVFTYSLTNVVILKHVNKYSNYLNFSRIKNFFLLCILLFLPYRLHLSVHVLKDTLVIFFICVMSTKVKFSKLAFIPLFHLRVFSVAYLYVLVKRKYIYLSIPVILLVLFLYSDIINLFLLGQNEKEMTFREFDNVPNFSQMGFPGIIIRAIVWPFFMLSGLFLVISPSIAYFPVALGAMMIQIWSLITFRKFAVSLSVYIILSLIAVLVTGFTSYIRYCFPITVVLPLLLLSMHHADFFKNKGRV